MKTQKYNASKDLAAIGQEIAAQYARGDGRRYRAAGYEICVNARGERYEAWGDDIDFIEFTVENGKYRCPDNFWSVSNLVKRYQNAKPHKTKSLAAMLETERGPWPETVAQCLADVKHEILDE